MTDSLKERYLRAKRALIKKYIGTRLNDRQTDAAVATDGPLLIIAGAGSGKTTVLVQRIVFIIKYGNAYHSDYVPENITENYVSDMEMALRNMPAESLEPFISEFASRPCPPYAMLAITFTNKAAREIKERLTASFGSDSAADEIWAGTFHSVCVRILRRHSVEAGFGDDFSIYDTDDKKHMLADVMKSLNISDKTLPIKTVANEISGAKDRLETPDDYAGALNLRGKEIKKVYAEYQRRMRACNALDFDDIIAETVYLFERHPEILEYYQNKFRYVCIDEYQDTNYAQFRLTQLISAKNRNIMVVGDDDQSIYRFRGATIENILNFDKTYPDAKVVKLEQNYRSTKNILDAANAVISHNDKRRDKALWCESGEGEKITLHTAQDQNDESRYIAKTIASLVADGKYEYRDFAILYRVNEIARSLESAFAKSGMPYRILGGQRFYDKKEIKDILAYLHIIYNDRDDQRLRRIINEPKRKIGAATVDAVASIADEIGVSMLEVMRRSPTEMLLSKVAPKLVEFTSLIDGLRSSELSVSELVDAVFERTGYKQMLIDGGEVEKPRIAAVEELISAAQEYEQRVEGPTLQGFLEEVSLVADVDKYDEDANAVVMMTVHSAKGLEFPVVFLSAMEENIFPSSQNVYYEEEMAEERRLAYVAITRAKRKLYITHTSQRLLYGRTSINQLSRFIAKEVPPKLVEKDRIEQRPKYGYTSPAPSRQYSNTEGYRANEALAKEFVRKVAEKPATPKTPSSFGVERLPVGTRVSHQLFGNGVILSLREMGGDMLYEVKFDSGVVKKLMATYAKLKKIQ